MKALVALFLSSAIVFLLGLAAAPGTASAALGPAPRYFVYVSEGGSNSISIFVMNPATGELAARAGVSLAGAPGPLAISPDHKFLYAALRQSKSVQSLRVDPKTGALAPLGTAETGVNPAYLIPDRNGRFMLMADYGGDRITVRPLHADGSVGVVPVVDRSTGRNPHSIQTDPANRFAFVPLCGADKVLQFRFDPRTGNLEPNSPPEVRFNTTDGPRHFAFHPKLDVVYVVNEKSSSVTTLKLNRKKGTMEPLLTLPTVPKDFTGKNTCADIHVTPDGRFVYASNRGHDSLAAFAVNPKTGVLTALGQTPTEKTPRAFEIEPTGNFIYAAGQASNRLASYRIDKKSGTLQPLKVYEVGKAPAWVLIVALR